MKQGTGARGQGSGAVGSRRWVLNVRDREEPAKGVVERLQETNQERPVMRERASESGTLPGARTPDPGSRAGVRGLEYWRSLDELADTPEYRELVANEFPGLADELLSPQTRRAFLKVMGASLGIAGLASCRWPKELIMPFANRPEGRIPGVPQQYATAFELGGAAVGLLVKSFDGRPIKVEGNPLHPTSLGAATALAQASVLEVYDPDRSRRLVNREAGQEFAKSWDDFAAYVQPRFAGLQASRGASLAVLSEESSSPSLARLRERLLAAFPLARWVEWEPISRDDEREGTRLAFGRPMRPRFDVGAASVIVCLDADPLCDHPAALRHAREFGLGRRADAGTMNRLYAAEPLVSITGAMADHRLAVGGDAIGALGLALAAELAMAGVRVPPLGRSGAPPSEAARAFVRAAAKDLAGAGASGLVIAGPRQGAAVHALAHLINVALGAVGTTVTYLDPGVPDRPPHVEAIAKLVEAMHAGEVGTLLILGGNPVFDAPADLDFAAALERVDASIHLGAFDDETSRRCRWHLPRAHYLETWGDARAWDGTLSVQQPLIDALYGGRSPIEVLATVLGESATRGYEIVRATLTATLGSDGFEPRWRRVLDEGLVRDSAFKPVRVAVAPGAADAIERGLAATPPAGASVVFAPDAKVHDGRFANNAWLQELPDQLSKVVWDNAAIVGPGLASRLGVTQGDVVRVARGGRALEIAVYVMPGVAEDTVVLPLGYGRTAAGRVADGVGVNTYALRTSDAPYLAAGVSVEKTGRTHVLISTHDHQAIDRVGFEARGIRIKELIREATLAEYRARPDFAREGETDARTALFTAPKFTGEHQWGMSIDLSACIGCAACMVACQAENNIAVVGKDEVRRGREMHWIRVDRYFKGKPANPKLAFQPVACQQCENAPCEEVCPVAATNHSEEGLNQQVYNRCVGTRYCSNNCPYKVRRFNFFNWFLKLPETEKMVFNPDVTVRGRGVMEKCSFCIQRIEAVKIAAKNDGRPIHDGEITPACAQTCPTRAIVFGDLKDESSRVAKTHRHPRAYGILTELATRPRNLYLAKLRNPAPGAEES
jgi:MoCo/4Fe-4S cofactor protein with predicted Tat translocation signal